MYEQILVPLDGSDTSKAALEVLGSVAEGVARRAAVPVLLIRSR